MLECIQSEYTVCFHIQDLNHFRNSNLGCTLLRTCGVLIGDDVNVVIATNPRSNVGARSSYASLRPCGTYVANSQGLFCYHFFIS
jgi:hypothetical protein